MRVRDLIADLQKCDPDAMVDSVCGVDQLPGFYDGPSHYVVRNVDGGREYVIDRHHRKVRFDEVDLTDLFMDDPATPVTFIAHDGTRYDLGADDLPEEAKRYAPQVVKARKVAANILVSAKSAIPIKARVHCSECYALIPAPTQADDHRGVTE